MTDEQRQTFKKTAMQLLHDLFRERDEARFVARALWDFIQEGDFAGALEMGDRGTPEFELWVKGHVATDLAYEHPWIRYQEEEPPMPRDHSFEATAAGIGGIDPVRDALLPTVTVTFWFKDPPQMERFIAMLEAARDTNSGIRAEPLTRKVKKTP